MRDVVINVLPHPRIKGDWLVECPGLLPKPPWYKSREDALYYAKLLSRENGGEIQTLDLDDSTEELKGGVFGPLLDSTDSAI